MNCKFFTIACALLSMSFCSWANENKTDSVGYQFTVTKELKTNPVKDQSRSGTCWSFSTLSFIEDDLLRQGKPAVDLSEMFIVRNDYIEKAIKYVRMHGDIAFSAGGSAYDRSQEKFIWTVSTRKRPTVWREPRRFIPV